MPNLLLLDVADSAVSPGSDGLEDVVGGRLKPAGSSAKLKKRRFISFVERNLFGTVDTFKCFISDISQVSDNIGLTLLC
jgi:hypothetical protein